MKHLLLAALCTSSFGILTDSVAATLLPNTTANGVVSLTYHRAAWATIAPIADYTDIHANPTGMTNSTADVDGRRWMFPDRFEGTNWVGAAYPADYLTPLPDHPLAQPVGGFALAVNSYGTNSFAGNHAVTTFNSTTNPNGLIGLGGSFRSTSDFNEPGASVWWEHLALLQDPVDGIWKIQATSGPGKGSLFELRNVTVETIDGNLHLSADYVFGNTDWLQFFQDVNGHLDTNAILGHIDLIPSGVARVLDGMAVINYSQSAWESLASRVAPPPVLTLTAFFNQLQANALPQEGLLNAVQTSVAYSNQVYAMNGASVTNLPTRYTQPTSFLYPRGQLAQHIGRIGLGGVARFAVLGGLGGNLLFGDYTLQYDASRLALGGTGWYLLGNIPPAAAVFDLLDVRLAETPTSFTLSANLGVSFELANFLFSTPEDTLANVGTFTFTGFTSPLTTPVIQPPELLDAHIILQATNGLPGSSLTWISTTNLMLPASGWISVTNGFFDPMGRSSNSLPVLSPESNRFYRILQP